MNLNISSTWGALKSNSEICRNNSCRLWIFEQLHFLSVTFSLTSTKCRYLIHSFLQNWALTEMNPCMLEMYLHRVILLFKLFALKYLIACVYENYYFLCRGLFITIHDRGHIATMLKSWPESVIKVIAV